MKTRTLLLIPLLFIKLLQAQNIEWKHATEGKIHSTPTIINGMLFIGSDDQKLYAINAETGEREWTYSTDYAVKCTPLVQGNSIYITSGSALHRINKNNGSVIVVYKPEAALNGNPKSFIDEWDYHTSSPFAFNDMIIFGDQWGNIQIFDTATNEGSVYFATEGGHAIRTTINISDSIMYFGDWDGTAYALDMKSKKLKWEYKSFDEKPYDSFGAYVTQPIIYNGKLYMGARNYTFAVIDITSGSKVWDYTHAGGGWITGTPLFVNDTMYLGGSDNKEMIAFNPETGDKHWVFNTKQNVFCEAAYINGKLLFVDGDSYNHSSGTGFLYALDAKNGEIVNQIAMNTNIYSSPQIEGNKIFFGGYNNEVYGFNLNKVINPSSSTFSFPEEPVDQLTVNETSNDYFKFSASNTGEGFDTIELSCVSNINDVVAACVIQPAELSIMVNETKSAKIKFKTNNLSAGSYTITILATSKRTGEQVYSKSCELIIPEATNINKEPVKGFKVYPNPVNDKVNCQLHLENNGHIEIHLCALNGKKLISKNLGNISSGEHNFSLKLNNDMADGIYLLAVKVNEQVMAQEKIYRFK